MEKYKEIPEQIVLLAKCIASCDLNLEWLREINELAQRSSARRNVLREEILDHRKTLMDLLGQACEEFGYKTGFVEAILDEALQGMRFQEGMPVSRFPDPGI